MAIKGFDKVKANVMKMKRAIRAETGRILRREMELVITKAKTLCPVDVGTLRSSGMAEGGEETLRNPIIAVEGSFGNGPSGKYALYVHEGVGVKSGRSGGMNISYKVGQPKFLEEPFKESTHRLKQTLASEIAKRLAAQLASKG
jgi:hypothetical protein